ncbi:MAG: hypothetical protein J1E34_07695 [Oscillospiraceae bacterium]|nr:hypothetical protein [Oscillospiraceae bacterium]
MLTALEIIMAFTPPGYLRIGIISITFMTIPVIIGESVNGVALGTVFRHFSLRFSTPYSLCVVL